MIVIIDNNLTKNKNKLDYDKQTAIANMLFYYVKGVQFITKFSELDNTTTDKINHLKKMIEQHTEYISFIYENDKEITKKEKEKKEIQF